MNPKKSLSKKTTFNKNMTGGKKKRSKKKGSKKKGSKKRSGKKKSGKKKSSKKRSVTRVVNRPVFYNTYDPLTDYLSAARLGSSFNNISSLQQQNQALQQQIQTRNSYDSRAALAAQTNAAEGFNPGASLSINDPALNLDADGHSHHFPGTAAAPATRIPHRSYLPDSRAPEPPTDGSVLPGAYGPGFLQPDFGGQDMIGNPSLDDMFHQEEIMMNGGGLGAAAAHRAAAVRKVKADRERRKREQQRKVQKKTTSPSRNTSSIIPYPQPIPQPPQPEPYGRSRPSRRRPAAQPVSMVGGFDF